MSIENAKGARLNKILEKKIFKENDYVDNDESKSETGLTIEELIICWIFDHRNDFKKQLREWKDHGKLMNFKEIQGH